MNVLYLSYKNVVSKPISALLSVLLMAFGVAIIIILLLGSHQLKEEASNTSQGVDLVVGAKGSPLQLILSSIFHADFPTGNVKLKEAYSLNRNRLVAQTIPLSLGDAYRGYRIVGTNQAYLDLYDVEIASGKISFDGLQVIAGSEVAEKLGLNLGDELISSHGLGEGGLDHDEHAYKVGAILKRSGSVIDKLLITNLRSVWEVHGSHEDEEMESDSLIDLESWGIKVNEEEFESQDITSVLLTYRSPMGAVQLPRYVNSQTNMQAASPAFEIARLTVLLDPAINFLTGLGYFILFLAVISIFIALLNSLKERKYELAVMRSLGASRTKVFIIVILEGFVVSLLGIVIGFLLSHGILELLGNTGDTFDLTGLIVLKGELFVLLGSFVLGGVAAIVPGILAYRSEISETLAKG